ncbi:MAG: hypothetical protein AB8B73_11180 [Ekhidna sp.]
MENLTKLEKNCDGSYTVTCDNRCETENVSEKDIILGNVCKKEYPDREGSFIGIGESFDFTCFAEKCKSRQGIDDDILDVDLNLRKFTLKRNDRFHHSINEQGKALERDCIRNQYGYAYDYYSRFAGHFSLRIYVKDKSLEIVEIMDGNNWYHCIEGNYDDTNTLKEELKKRLLRKKAGDNNTSD